MKLKTKIYKCRYCAFVDRPPKSCSNLPKCPYCFNDDWLEMEKTNNKMPLRELKSLVANAKQNDHFVVTVNPQTILDLIAKVEGLSEALKFYLPFNQAKEALAKFGPDVELK